MKYSKIIKDALALFAITMVAGIALGYVYEITKGPIEASKLAAKQKAYQAVYEGAGSFEESEALQSVLEDARGILEKGGFSNITIDEALEAKGADGCSSGLVMAVTTGEGYGGNITLTLGIDKDKTIKGVEILSINETAGLGMKAKEAGFRGQYQGKQVEQFTVTKSGASSENEIDAISGATITTDAVTGAVNAGIYFTDTFLKAGGIK